MTDYILLVCLIGVLPVRALYKSFRAGPVPASRPRRYLVSSAIVAGLLVLLWYDWWHGARPAVALGLDVPVSQGGLIGFVIVAGLVVAAAVIMVAQRSKDTAAKREKAESVVRGNDLMPRTRDELVQFLGLALLLGCGWELLYRGFLIGFLVPRIGVAGAVCIAAIAYGAAHGCKSRVQFLGSMVSAFAFTIAFVLTRSLWWLMVIHVAMGVFGGINAYRVVRGADLKPPRAGAVGGEAA